MDTIVALATSPVPAPRHVLRLSGPEALGLVQALAGRACPARGWVDAVWASPYGPVPLQVWGFEGPHSFTGEDVAEVHFPGSPLLGEALLHHLQQQGARHARAGEFSQRAFLNGRIDLSQAEAIMSLVGTISADASRRALDVLGGSVRQDLETCLKTLENLCARLEVSFDFDEEAAEQVAEERFLSEARSALHLLNELAPHAARLSSDRPHMVLAGDTNVGKSSLLNRLGGRQRAVVADEEGTTRDAVTLHTELGSTLVAVTDLAGLQAPTNEIEADAVECTKRLIFAADLVVVVIPCHQSQPSTALLAAIGDVAPRSLCVLRSMADRGPPQPLAPMLEALPTLCTSPQQEISEVRNFLAASLLAALAPHSAMVSLRASGLAASARQSLEEAVAALEGGIPTEVVSGLARAALSDIRELMGSAAGADVLEHIFANFCIGK